MSLRNFDPDSFKSGYMSDLWDGLSEVMQDPLSPGRTVLPEPDSVLQWITENEIKNEKGKLLEYVSHKFLVDILEDFTPKQAIKKCAQIGFSVTTTIKDIYLAYFRNYTIIYTLPTREMVYEYVPTKVDILIDKNPILQQMVISRDSSTQKKRCGDGFVLYKGTFGEREAIMTSSDLNTYDECDRSNLDVIGALESRLGSSEYKGEWWFSNPTFPNVGVCKKYDESDQKKWHVKCTHCNREIQISWPDHVDYEREIYFCPGCLNEISDETRANGFWVAHNPGSIISGYHISKIMVPWVSAREMLKYERDKKPDLFHNFDLGEGYQDGTKSVTRDVIESCEVKNIQYDGYLAIGIDQGPSKIHCVIGPRSGISRLVICDNWGQVDDLISNPNVRSIVVDAQPEVRETARLATKYPYKLWCCYYVDDPKRPANLEPLDWNDPEGIVKAERTSSIDDTVYRFLKRDINMYLDSKDSLYKHNKNEKETFVGQWESMFIIEGTDKMGNRVKRWAKSGPDHWAHATNYWNMAVQKLPRRIRKKSDGPAFTPHNPYTGY